MSKPAVLGFLRTSKGIIDMIGTEEPLPEMGFLGLRGGLWNVSAFQQLVSQF